MNTKSTLSTLQYNVRKSKDTVMATLLRDPRIQEYDILAIQEPWKNPFSATTHHPAKDFFHLCYPAMEEGESARVCFFINKQLDHSKWHFRNAGGDLCTLVLRQVPKAAARSPYTTCIIPIETKKTDEACCLNSGVRCRGYVMKSKSS